MEETQRARKRRNRPKGQGRELTDPNGKKEKEETQSARKRRKRPKGHGIDPKGKEEN